MIFYKDFSESLVKDQVSQPIYQKTCCHVNFFQYALYSFYQHIYTHLIKYIIFVYLYKNIYIFGTFRIFYIVIQNKMVDLQFETHC